MDSSFTAPRPSSLLLLSVLAALPAAALAQDSDGDGVPNASDTFPCDSSAAAVSFAPGENAHGTMVFEDLWPIAGDLDFNDVVLRYNYTFYRDATGNVRRVRAVYNVTALGGALSNGLGLHLPVAGSAVSSITRSIGGGAAQPLTRSSADAQLTVSLSNNLRELFGNTSGQINSLTTQPRSTGQVLVVDITFASAVAMSTGGAPFDLYIFRSDDSGHEVHRPEFAGTAAMRTALFNTEDDDSTASRRFVDFAGLPFALVFPSAVSFPREAYGISTLFPNIVPYALSAGTTNLDFYTSSVIASSAYQDSAGLGAPSPSMPSTTIDTSCVPVTPPPTTYIGSTQTWTVPAGVTSVRIEAWGAEGGRGGSGGVGGRGARVAGTFAVSPGQVLTVSVGGRGGNGISNGVSGGGGGGGTFVSRAGTPLLIAGGGGGASYTGGAGQPGRAVEAGGLGGYTNVRPVGQGGFSDNGGGGGLGAGGGGWLSAGIGNNWISVGGAAAGGAGGPMHSNYGGYGGWGGGGGSMHGGGGGGGYTGGNGGSYSIGGGGGGSYNAGTNPSATEGVQTGNGSVSFIY